MDLKPILKNEQYIVVLYLSNSQELIKGCFINNYMKISTARQGSAHIKRHGNNGEITVETIKQKMLDFLQSRIADVSMVAQLLSIMDLDLLIQKFSDLLALTSVERFPLHPSYAQQKQLLFYRERIANLQRKIKDLKNENLSLMKQTSNKQAEINEKDGQIFELKMTVQQKQQTIIRLTKTLRNKGHTSALKASKTQKLPQQQIKIVVNTPKASIQPPKLQIPLQGIDMKKERQIWQQQKSRLLRVIRQKDLKIYELIQSMESQ